MAAFQERLAELEELGATVLAASVDGPEKAQDFKTRHGLGFPVAYGVTEEQSELFSPWWNEDHHGRYIQPAEFLLTRGGVVFGSMYASGPVGRMEPDEVIRAIDNRERRRTTGQ